MKKKLPHFRGDHAVRNHDVLLRSPLRTQWVQSDFKSHFRRFGFEIGQTLGVLAYVAGVEVLVRGGVTGLAAEQISMKVVLNRILRVPCLDSLVTVETAGGGGHVVAVVVGRSIAMHLRSGMAFHAVEILGSVDIRRHAFVLAKVFPFNSAAMAGDAVIIPGIGSAGRAQAR